MFGVWCLALCGAVAAVEGGRREVGAVCVVVLCVVCVFVLCVVLIKFGKSCEVVETI